jgi:uncharacterized protein (DUF1501 family)
MRRQLLHGLGASLLSSVWAAPWAFAQESSGKRGRLVLVFLRGAYDGLSALVPHGDPAYYQLRPTIALPRPDGSDDTTLALDTLFGLHPALASLYPLWQQGVLAVVPAAGSPDPTRSHFDAQHHWETGIPGKTSNTAGWMNTLAGLLAGPASEARSATTASPLALGVGESNPAILGGNASVRLVPQGEAATRTGSLADTRSREALLRLYTGDDALAQAFRKGTQSRMETASVLTQPMDGGMQAESREMQAANNGAGPAKGLLLDAQHLGLLMRRDRNLRLGFLSAGGWDTHANQGSTSGALAGNLRTLAQTLLQLRRDFSEPNDVVLVCSEFGRTAAENGTRGTDHGHGNALWLMGNGVQGGRWHGKWSGLSAGNLHEDRDLPVHHDFRAVLAQVIRGTFGLRGAQADALFPGYQWDSALDTLMRS